MPETQAGSTTKAGQGAREQTKASEPKAAPVCTVAFCPICMAVTAGQGAAPDVIDHLLAAAREFFLAARAVIDVRGDQVKGGSDETPNGSKGFEHIEIS